MKTSIKTIAATIVLSALFAGPASAMTSQGDLNRNIQWAMSGYSNVIARIQGDTVTLTGYFASGFDQQQAVQTARESAGVNKVINLARPSN